MIEAILTKGVVNIVVSKVLFSPFHDVREKTRLKRTGFFTFGLYKEKRVYRQPFNEDLGKVEDFENFMFYVKNNSVYYHPHIDFELANGRTRTKYFRSIPDLEEFLELFLKENPHVLIK